MSVTHWMLRSRTFIGALLIGLASGAYGECEIESDSNALGVRYEVTSTQGDEVRVEQMAIWRLDGRLLHERPASQMADLWERTRNGRLHLIRYFDAHQRAIEYQPDDLGFSEDGPFAQRLALLEALCADEAYTYVEDQVRFIWRRTEVVTDPEAVMTAFEDRSRYASTDYADIGDNESDPFLLRMVNLGFVEHGGSGFYDADGHDMGGRHNH